MRCDNSDAPRISTFGFSAGGGGAAYRRVCDAASSGGVALRLLCSLAMSVDIPRCRGAPSLISDGEGALRHAQPRPRPKAALRRWRGAAARCRPRERRGMGCLGPSADRPVRSCCPLQPASSPWGATTAAILAAETTVLQECIGARVTRAAVPETLAIGSTLHRFRSRPPLICTCDGGQLE